MIDIPREPRIPWPSWQYVWADKRWTATMTCPNGHPGYLGDHDIAADGTVSPSVVCPAEGCGFHDTVRLAGWDANREPLP